MKLSQAVQDATVRLEQAGVPTPDFDARVLAAHVLDIRLSQLPMHRQRLLTGDELAAFEGLVASRARREPLQYLTGDTEFYGLRFLCDRRALVPRPDTETLIEVAVELAEELGITRIADIGTGCGIIAVTLAHQLPEAELLATDSSEEALALAAENVALHKLQRRVTLACGSWLEPLHDAGWADSVEMIVSNPPYIREEDLDTLMPEIVEHEPREALVGPDADGMGAYRAIVASCRELPALRAVAFEVGQGQAAAVGDMIRDALHAREIIVRKDLGQINRVVAAILEVGER